MTLSLLSLSRERENPSFSFVRTGGLADGSGFLIELFIEGSRRTRSNKTLRLPVRPGRVSHPVGCDFLCPLPDGFVWNNLGDKAPVEGFPCRQEAVLQGELESSALP